MIAIHAAIAILFLWLALAYGGLPRVWSHHEHKLIGSRDQLTSYTAQDIPADPLNLYVEGSKEVLVCVF